MSVKISIITELPFRKQGNQSLIRFSKMFLDRNCHVDIMTSGKDDRGVRVITDTNFRLVNIPKITIFFEYFISLAKRIKTSHPEEKKASPKKTINHFLTMRSDEIIPPFGRHTSKVMIRKWLSFVTNYLDNLFFVFYVLIFHSSKIRESDVIIGYEYGKAIAAKIISILFRKKYVNKYQGTVLKIVKRNITDACRYYPSIYYGLNRSDLCLMVNDGTDGEFYAKHRKCKEVIFEPHGVGIEDYVSNNEVPNVIRENSNKFIFFNNASRSRWKRVDRVIRAMSLLEKECLEDILLITTYHADDKELLIEYTGQLGLEKNVIFLDNLNHVESNAMIQYSDVVIMTNEMSNLGNPVLEAIYYGTPVITLDDGSMEGFLEHEVDGVLIEVSENMDLEMASAIKQLAQDEEYYKDIKYNIKQNRTVHSLKEQQLKEFTHIEKFISD